MIEEILRQRGYLLCHKDCCVFVKKCGTQSSSIIKYSSISNSCSIALCISRFNFNSSECIDLSLYVVDDDGIVLSLYVVDDDGSRGAPLSAKAPKANRR